MSDFNSEFWSWFIDIIVVGGIVWLIILLRVNSKGTLPRVAKPRPRPLVMFGMKILRN